MTKHQAIRNLIPLESVEAEMIRIQMPTKILTKEMVAMKIKNRLALIHLAWVLATIMVMSKIKPQRIRVSIVRGVLFENKKKN